MSTRIARDNEIVGAFDLRLARPLTAARCGQEVVLDALRERKRGGVGAMSKHTRAIEQPETRSQRRIYDQATELAKRYVHNVLSAPDHSVGRAWSEGLRSKHGN